MGAFATFARISNHPSSRFLRAAGEEFNGYRGRGREYGLAPHIPGCSLRPAPSPTSFQTHPDRPCVRRSGSHPARLPPQLRNVQARRLSALRRLRG